MDFTIQYFFFIKLLMLLFIAWIAYKAYKKNFKSKLLNGLTIVLFLVFMVSPFKLDVDTKKQTDRTNVAIEEAKILPPKVEDNTFKNTKVKGIEKGDLE